MMHGKRLLLPLALGAALLHGLALTGCGGNSSPTGVANSGEVRLKLNSAAAVGAGNARAAFAASDSAEIAGAAILVDGAPAGVTDADGEITLQLEPGIHSITVSSGDVTSSTFQVTIGEGEVLTLEVEMEADGTLDIEQDIDHDGDVDDDDDLDDDDDVEDDDDDDDEDSDDDDDAGTTP